VAATVIQTGRGDYTLSILQVEGGADRLSVTLILERADGIERVAFLCSVPSSLVPPEAESDASALLPGIARWLTCEFEQIREAALKSVRSDHRLLEVAFDPSAAGPLGS